MTTQPPPPRYRVVEQGRRLVVIDRATGVAPGAPNRREAMEVAVLRAAAAWDPLFRQVTRWACSNVIDDRNRPILVTEESWDKKGPRWLALDPDGVRLFGASVIFGAVMQIVLVGLAFTTFGGKVALGVQVLTLIYARSPIATYFTDLLQRHAEDVSGAE